MNSDTPTRRLLTRIRKPVGVTEIAGVRLLQIQASEFESARDFVKRATDLALAVALVLFLLPLLLLLAVAVKLDSPGPVLFVSDRVGFGRRHFKFYKFRTMVMDAEARRAELLSQNEQSGPLFKIHEDPRVTAMGRLIRRFSLDELPQLLNVIRGDMSLVGPRPLPASDLDMDGRSTRHQSWSIERATVRPGITGLWQVRGRSALPFEEMMRLETLYVQTRSYRLDLQILVETIPAVLTGRGAT
jgi:lipopolysaccharide/colanic/teichoic acid biosynthesis glycosyltransferase